MRRAPNALARVRASRARRATGTALRVLAIAGVLIARDLRADDSRVRPGETLAGSRSERSGQTAPGLVREPISPVGLAARSGGAMIVLGVLAGTFLVLRRRCRVTDPGGIPIDIVARKAISPRHSIVVLDVAGERLVVGLCGDRMTALAAGPPAPPLAPSLSGARVSEPSIRTDLLQLSAGTTGTSPLSAPVPSVAVTLREDHGDEDAMDGEEEEEEVDRLPGETALSRRLRDRRGDHPRPLEPLFSRDDDLEEREQLRPEDLAPYRHSVDRVRSFLNEEEEEGPSLAEKRRRGEAGGREGGRA